MLNRVIIMLMALSLPLIGQGNELSVTQQKIVQALQGDIRTEAEKQRDVRRKPLETLSFFGLEEDMRVLELFPGGGWYSKILAPVLEEKGELYLALGINFMDEEVKAWGGERFRFVDEERHLWQRSKMHRYIRYYDKIDFGLQNLDMVLTFRNMHNMTPNSRRLLNREVFRSLKPGGIYGVIDHTRRHMEPYSVDRWRRVDPVMIIKEALDAGFELEAWSDLHARAEDGLIYDSVHPSIDKFSDRFTLKFRKPER
ncbi:class I SAM-dependent methyltransferase [Neptuniibacter halophilus]|uniref:class I SAM-dependent methyltransferase n=1 Tax=Neptuniibacter halophilus TaxID=651666 RepID=UPI002572B71B|nr:hypothetical protein [Neptuniibacter halophilus]